jgi:hypothetical protein
VQQLTGNLGTLSAIKLRCSHLLQSPAATALRVVGKHHRDSMVTVLFADLVPHKVKA